MKRFIRLVFLIAASLGTTVASGQSHGWTVNPAEWDYNGTVTAIVFRGTNEVTTGTLGAFVGTSCRGYIDGSYFPPTGKTVFTLMCYSDLASGETLTFKYFDPADNSYYNIAETIPFSVNMIVGDAMNPQQFHTLPLVYAVTGGGSFCEGGAGLPVGLADSEVGVTYTLYEGANAQTPNVTGTGSAISFGNRKAGTFTVKGSNSGGTINMSGSAIITETPPVSTPVFTLGSSSIRCQGAGKVTYTATASNTTGITYSLDASSLAGGNSIDAGTGEVTYTAGWSGASVITASAAGCNGPKTANHTVSITPSVGTPVFTLGTTSNRCQGAGTVTYTATATNTTAITYSLDASSLTGGNSINSSTGAVTYVAGWSGASTITASASGCNGPATASHTVTITPTVGTPAFTIGATSTRCQGAGTVTYTATASNSTGITYSLDLTSLTGGNSINSSTGAVTYVSGWNGTSVITASAAGCNGPVTANHSVTITPTVGIPVFALGETSTRCQGAGTVIYTATASNTTGITYTLDAASITGGNSINPGTGAVTYVAGWSGTSTITASAPGCNGPRTATHTVSISPPVGIPVFNLGATSTRCQGTGTVTYAANANNTTGITYSLDLASLAGGNTINSGTGAGTYNAGWNGTTVITASAAGCGGPTTATHIVTVSGPVGTPSFNLGSSSTRCQGSEIVIYTATASNSTGITYSLDAASLSAGNTINSGTGAVTYTAGWPGPSVITASAAGCSGPATSTHTVTITPSVTIPVFALGSSSGRCQGAATMTYTATANNTTGINYNLDGASLGAGNSININTGAVTFTAVWSGSSVITASAAGCNGPAIASHTVPTRPTPTAGISATTTVWRNA